MPTITIHPEHVEGLRYVIRGQLERACESIDIDVLREIIPLGDHVGWKHDDPAPSEIELSAELLETLADEAWGFGNCVLADVHACREKSKENLQLDRECEGRSLLAFHEHVEAQGVKV